MKREFRDSGQNVVTVVDAKKHQVMTDVCPYNVVDEYRTRWIPGVWTASLETRKPPMVWAHDWKEPIGPLHDFDDNKNRLRTVHQLDDFDAVPRARQAWAQFESGTLTDASFGFSRSKDRPAEDQEGVYDILEARMDEVSPVLVGAVPGAGNFSTRGIPAEAVAEMARSLEAGEMTLPAALAIVRSFGGTEVRALHSHARQDGGGDFQHSHAGNDAVGHAHPAAHGSPALMPLQLGRAATGGTAGNPNNPDTEDTVMCPNCGAMNETDALFCDQCGQKLTDPTQNGVATDANRDALAADTRAFLADLGRR